MLPGWGLRPGARGAAMPRHREPRGTPSAPGAESLGPQDLGEPPPVARATRQRAIGRASAGRDDPSSAAVALPLRRVAAAGGASLRPAHWPVASPARSLWVAIRAPWYKFPPRAGRGRLESPSAIPIHRVNLLDLTDDHRIHRIDRTRPWVRSILIRPRRGVARRGLPASPPSPNDRAGRKAGPMGKVT